MALAATSKVVLGLIAFAIFWVLAVFPAVPFLPIGRTAGSLLGAMLMVVFQVMTPDQAFGAIDLPILGLLFGTMVISVFLERANMFKYLGRLLAYKSRGGKDLLCRICLISAISSALFTNDTTCVILTEFVLKVARQNNLPPRPFLLALASSANIGSSATPIGNPQNLVIAVTSKISFGKFLLGVAPAMLIGVVINVVIILSMYWKELTHDKDEEKAMSEVVVGEDEVLSHRFSPATMSHNPSVEDSEIMVVHRNRSSSLNDIHKVVIGGSNTPSPLSRKNTSSPLSKMNTPSPLKGEHVEHQKKLSFDASNESNTNGYMHRIREGGLLGLLERKRGEIEKWRKITWKTCVYLVTLGMLVALLLGLNMSWSAITASLALIVLDFKDAIPCLNKVSYSLLIFFCGMFITVDGFNRTGIPSTLWDYMEPHARINHTSGVVVLTIVILVLSNIASNVPTVLLLGAHIAASAAATSGEETKAWLMLAWVSTVAGNLSLLGSAANLIVCEQARRAPPTGYTLSFWTHLRFGVPSTIIITAIGLPLIRG